MRLRVADILKKDYLVVLLTNDIESASALYGRFAEVHWGISQHFVQHDKDRESLVTVTNEGKPIRHPNLKFKHLLPIGAKNILGITHDELHLLQANALWWNKYNVGKVDHLIVDRHIAMFKQNDNWQFYPLDADDPNLKDQIVQINVDDPLFVKSVLTPKSVQLPLIIDKHGVYTVGRRSHIRPLLRWLHLEEPQKTSKGYVYQYKLSNITSQDIHRLLTLKPKQMEAIVSGNNQLTLYFLTEDGKLYGTGSNSGGRLGVSTNKVKEKKLLKEYQLIAEGVHHIDTLPTAGLIFSKDDGSYYVGPNSGDGAVLLGRKDSTSRPYKFTDEKIERFGFRSYDSWLKDQNYSTVLQFYNEKGLPYLVNSSPELEHYLRSLMLRTLLYLKPFDVSNYASRDKQRFKEEALPQMISWIPC